MQGAVFRPDEGPSGKGAKVSPKSDVLRTDLVERPFLIGSTYQGGFAGYSGAGV